VIEYANTSLEKDATAKYHIYAEAGIAVAAIAIALLL